MKKKWVYVIAAALVGVVVVGAAVLYTNGLANGNIVAAVAGEKITKAEYSLLLTDVKNKMEQDNKLADEIAKKNFWKTTKIEGKSAEDVAKSDALKRAQSLKIHLLKAKQANLVLDANDLSNVKKTMDSYTQSLNSYIKQSGEKITQDKAFIREFGVNAKEFEEVYKEFMLQSKFVVSEQKKINVTDEEMKKKYEDDKNKGEQVTVKHILVMTIDQTTQQPLPQDKLDEAKKKADEILAKVNAGEDFTALAKQYSEDPGSKDKGGEYTFGKGQMVKEFEEWSFKAKEGETGIIKTTYGYHIMKKPTFDEMKAKIKSDIAMEKYSKQVDEWMKDQQYSIITTKTYDAIRVQ